MDLIMFFLLFFMFALSVLLYAMPTIIGMMRQVSLESLLAIAAVNLLLGWTLIFWAAAFVMALKFEGREGI